MPHHCTWINMLSHYFRIMILYHACSTGNILNKYRISEKHFNCIPFATKAPLGNLLGFLMTGQQNKIRVNGISELNRARVWQVPAICQVRMKLVQNHLSADVHANFNYWRKGKFKMFAIQIYFLKDYFHLPHSNWFYYIEFFNVISFYIYWHNLRVLASPICFNL